MACATGSPLPACVPPLPQRLWHRLGLRVGDTRQLYFAFRDMAKGKDFIARVDWHLQTEVDRNTVFGERTFDAFNTSGSGKLYAEEFIASCWNFLLFARWSLIEFAYFLYDVKGHGYLETADLDKLVQQIYNAPGAKNSKLIRAARDELAELPNREGRVPLKVFMAWIEKHPSFLFPAYNLQKQLQKRVCGQGFWRSATSFRATQEGATGKRGPAQRALTPAQWRSMVADVIEREHQAHIDDDDDARPGHRSIRRSVAITDRDATNLPSAHAARADHGPPPGRAQVAPRGVGGSWMVEEEGSGGAAAAKTRVVAFEDDGDAKARDSDDNGGGGGRAGRDDADALAARQLGRAVAPDATGGSARPKRGRRGSAAGMAAAQDLASRGVNMAALARLGDELDDDPDAAVSIRNETKRRASAALDSALARFGLERDGEDKRRARTAAIERRKRELAMKHFALGDGGAASTSTSTADAARQRRGSGAKRKKKKLDDDELWEPPPGMFNTQRRKSGSMRLDEMHNKPKQKFGLGYWHAHEDADVVDHGDKRRPRVADGHFVDVQTLTNRSSTMDAGSATRARAYAAARHMGGHAGTEHHRPRHSHTGGSTAAAAAAGGSSPYGGGSYGAAAAAGGAQSLQRASRRSHAGRAERSTSPSRREVIDKSGKLKRMGSRRKSMEMIDYLAYREEM